MNCPPSIIVNTRSLNAELSGVQRYTSELFSRFEGAVERVSPVRFTQGMGGHLWEQIWLPRIARDKLLWSPANSGPLTVRQQVLTLHDVATIDHPEWFNPRFAGWYRWLLPNLIKRVLKVITGSEFTKRRLIEIADVDESHVVVIPDGVSENFYPRSNQIVQETRLRLGIPSAHYLLSVGTLEPRKNLARQLEAWSKSAKHLPDDIWLVVAGAKGKSNVFGRINLRELPPRVYFTGFVPDEDLPALYSGAIAQLCPSIYEGFGLPAIEAMATGSVPIASNCTSLPEVVGDGGILVDPLDSDAIAEAMVRIVRDISMRQTLRVRAIARSQSFSWNRTAHLTWQILAEVAA